MEDDIIGLEEEARRMVENPKGYTVNQVKATNVRIKEAKEKVDDIADLQAEVQEDMEDGEREEAIHASDRLYRSYNTRLRMITKKLEEVVTGEEGERPRRQEDPT